MTVSGEKWYKSGSFYDQNPDLSKVSIHYYNSNQWGSPYIYYYTDSETPVTWPGTAMTSDGNGWYSYDIYGFDEVKVIFSDNGANQIPQQNETGYTVTGEKWFINGTLYDAEPDGITVHFYDYNNWGNVNIYYYNGTLEGTSWTGVPMYADGDGWYTYKIYGYDEARVLFNNGRGTQIPDVMVEGFPVSDEMWYRNGTWTTERPDEITVYFYKPDGWSAPNIYYYLNDSDTGPAWPGSAMTEVSDGWYAYTITKYASAKVMFNDGTNQIPAQNQPGLDATGIMWYKNGVLCDSENDTDSDELLDYMELVLGTNINNADTDGDGLPDGYEVMTLGTDPLKADSDDNGTTDGQEDADSDTLNNLREYQLGTDPNKADTDDDGLTDSEEVNTYNTNPLEEDTDGDTLSDGDDVALGFSPLLQDTDGNGVLDCDEYITQTLDTERIDASLLTDNYAVPAITVFAKGNINSNTNISEYTGHLKGSEREYIGKAIEIKSENEIQSGTLTFTLDDDYPIKNYTTPDGESTNGLLICYNDGEDTTPLITDYDEETKTLSTNISSTGIYFVFDFMQWLESLGIEATENSTSEVQTFSARSNTSIASVDIKGQVDIVFAIDTTGSMGTAISNVKNNITDFVDDINAAGIKASFSLIDFRDITCDGQNYTHTVKNGNSNWFTNITEFKNKISLLSVDGGGDGPETPIDALEMARRLDMRNTSQKFIILVTDADYKTDNNYGISSMDEIAELLKDDNINVSVISNTSYQTMYHTLYDITGGIFADINGNFKTQLLTIADKINEETNNGYWAALNGLLPKIVKLDEMPTPTGTADTDDDGLLDREELTDTWPAKVIDVNRYYSTLLKTHLENIHYTYPTINVYDYYSDPTKEDTDGDKLFDSWDPKPLNTYNNGDVIIDFSYNSQQVEMLQRCLEYLGYLEMPIENGVKVSYGTFGGTTAAAFKLFQLNYGFSPEYYKSDNDEQSNDIVDSLSFLTLINVAINNGLVLQNSDGIYDKLELYNIYCKAYLPTHNKKYFENIPNVSLPLTEKQILSGVTIKKENSIYYYDYTKPINALLISHKEDCEWWNNHFTQKDTFGALLSMTWFTTKVNHGKEWDIKVDKNWDSQFKQFDIKFYASQFKFIYYNLFITPEDLGNITYGYWGSATGFSAALLLLGGDFAKLTSNLKDAFSKERIAKALIESCTDKITGFNVIDSILHYSANMFEGDSKEDKQNILIGVALYIAKEMQEIE